MTPDDYMNALEEPRRGEIRALDELIRETVPDLEPHVRYGMLGYGPYHYRYASGREGDASVVGLASNKRYISLYVACVVDGTYVAQRYGDRLPRPTSERPAFASSARPTSISTSCASCSSTRRPTGPRRPSAPEESGSASKRTNGFLACSSTPVSQASLSSKKRMRLRCWRKRRRSW